MPALLQKMDDPFGRVMSVAMLAFVSFSEVLDKALMLQYTSALMNELVLRQQSSKHRMVQGESATCIAVIAGVIKRLRTVLRRHLAALKRLVMNAKDEEDNRLRGEAAPSSRCSCDGRSAGRAAPVEGYVIGVVAACGMRPMTSAPAGVART